MDGILGGGGLSLLFYLCGVLVVFLCTMGGTEALLFVCVVSSDMLWYMDPFVMFP